MDIKELLALVLSNYGTIGTVLLGIIGILVYSLRQLWSHNKHLTSRIETLHDKSLEVINNNTEVITKLVERLSHGHDKNRDREED